MGADTLKYMSARDAVEDVESIRRALGNERLNLVSYSYGTKVAALYAQRYPAHVRSAVLDGVVDLAEDYTTQRLTQEQGYQHTFEQFAAWCAHNRPDCPLAAEPEAANRRMHALLAQLNAHPLTDKQGEAIDSDALIGLMSTEILWQEGWPDLAQTLRDLQKGRTGSYNRLKYQSPMGEHEQDALTVISCADAALQLPREQELQRLDRQGQRPHLLLDVRLAAEYLLGHQPESLNLPVANLRTHADSLDRATCYVVTPEGGIRSELAVHLLNQLGFDAYLLGDEQSAAA